DLAALEDVDVRAGALVGEDHAPQVVVLRGDALGELEELLVREVRPDAQPAQANGELDLPAGDLGRRAGEEGAAGQPALREEALAVPLDPVEGSVELVLLLAEDAGELAAPAAEGLRERLGPPPH